MTKVQRAQVVARLRQVADRIERGDAEATPALVKVLEVVPEDAGRKAPRISKAILDELEWRFENDTGPGVRHDDAIKKAVQTRAEAHSRTVTISFGKKKRRGAHSAHAAAFPRVTRASLR